MQLSEQGYLLPLQTGTESSAMKCLQDLSGQACAQISAL